MKRMIIIIPIINYPFRFIFRRTRTNIKSFSYNIKKFFHCNMFLLLCMNVLSYMSYVMIQINLDGLNILDGKPLLEI